ncbi:MAG: ABC transporter permease subunit [Verrucomicrobiota bacterium]
MNPITRKRLQRFRSIKRGYWSFLLLLGIIFLSAVAELWINNRALIVSYEGKLYFPTYGAEFTGQTFGESYLYEANYRELKKKFAEPGNPNWVLMPLVPYGPNESVYQDGSFPPYPPSFQLEHYLGTDPLGRDILARLVYGFRIALGFSLALMAFTYLLAIFLGCAMGYFGSWVDLLGQRLMEIWSNIPFLYIVIILASTIPAAVGANFRIGALLFVMVIFNWVGMAQYMRTATFKEKTRDYVAAARLIGTSPLQIIRRHLLPNTLSIVVTFIPFTIVSGITSLTALDFLGFGIPPPTASWGELLQQGTQRLDAPWIVSSTFFGMVAVLVLVTFVGEAIREAFDPKKFSFYR